MLVSVYGWLEGSALSPLMPHTCAILACSSLSLWGQTNALPSLSLAANVHQFMAASSPNNVRKISPDYVWLLLAGSLALGVLAFSNVSVMDDAYISFRYAYNLVEGHGLVFNEGEYVEGYTSLLWTLLMALPEL